VPTLEIFWPRFVDGYARANRQKPNGVAAKETIGRVHLIPILGTTRLDAITTEDVQQLKRRLEHRSAKTVNNVLTVLNVLLNKAVEWNVIDRVPCSIRLLPIAKSAARFHDFDEYERLVAAAQATAPLAHLVVLLGGEAGLRCGEMMALQWCDVDLTKRQLCVERSDWKGHVTVPKSGRLRYVPLTGRLATALRACRHLRGARVLCAGDGSPLTQRAVQGLVRRAARRANLRHVGVHVLRHTFCSHLSMRGARCAPFKNSPATRSWARRSGTCISAQQQSKVRFVCWTSGRLFAALETGWRRLGRRLKMSGNKGEFGCGGGI